MEDFDIVAVVCTVIVIYMIIGCTIFMYRQILYNFKVTVLVFATVIIALTVICILNYLKMH